MKMHKIEKDNVINLLQELVAIESPYFEEDNIMKYVYKWFKDNSMDAFIHEYHESKVTGFKGKNIVVNLEGKEEGPTICINGHLDTVRLSSGWTTNPKGEIKGDRLYGVGALDMKSGCAASMIALKTFVRNYKNDFKGKIISTYVSVEEGPYGMGTNALIEEGYIKDIDYSIITEPSAGFTGKSFPDLCLGARGGYGLSVEFFGKASHAATPEQGVSAATDAAKVIIELENVNYIEDSYLGTGDVAVVGIECDGGACSIPDYAKVNLFWHIVVGEDQTTITEEIEKAVKRANIKSEHRIKFRESPSEASKGFMPYTITGEDPLTKKFIKIVEDSCGKKPTYSYFSSIGDFNYLGSRLDAPAIIFGAAGKNFHSNDEYVELDSVYKTAKVIYKFLEEILYK